MKLSKKTLIYSILLASVIAISIYLYLIFLLPSLYVENMRQNNFDQAIKLQGEFMRDKKIPKDSPKGISNVFYFLIKNDSDEINIMNNSFNSKIEIKDKKLKEILSYFKSLDFTKMDKDTKIKYTAEEVGEIFKKTFLKDGEGYKILEFNNIKNDEVYEENMSSKIHNSKNFIVMDNSIKDNKIIYSTYIGLGKENGDVYISFAPQHVSRLTDITSVVLQSLPMVIAFLFVLAFLSSMFFTKKIVDPIKKVASHTDNLRKSRITENTRLKINTKDEVSDLAKEIDDMYAELVENIKKVENENEKKELFIKASSHQLKTPISASLLLIDGMIDNIGKFKERDKYLVEVKKQIRNMQKIVEDLLLINKPIDKNNNQDIEVSSLLQSVVNEYKLSLIQKDIVIKWNIKEVVINTDILSFKKILENLLSNAIEHTRNNKEILINLDEDKLIFSNEGMIPKEIENNIFEPFISSKENKKSSGLGLYVASKFAKALNLDLKVENSKDKTHVNSTITFNK